MTRVCVPKQNTKLIFLIVVLIISVHMLSLPKQRSIQISFVCYLTQAISFHSKWIEECCFNIPTCYVYWNMKLNYSRFAVSLLFRWYPQSDSLVYPACDHHHRWDADEQHHSPSGEHVTRTLPVPAPLPLCRRRCGSPINHAWGCFYLQRPKRHRCHREHPQHHLLGFAPRRSTRSFLPFRGAPGANLP